MREDKKAFWVALVLVFLLPFAVCVQVNGSATALSDNKLINENQSTVQKAIAIAGSESIGIGQQPTGPFQGSSSTVLTGGYETLQLSPLSNSSSFSRHIMCKDYQAVISIPPRYNPIEPTTVFSPSDTKAVILTTISISNKTEFRWYYRGDSLETWISCYNWTQNFPKPGEYDYAGYLYIAGYWPGSNYPRAYKVEVYLDDSPSPSFSDFFEVTNGGLNGPRMCNDVDLNGNPVFVKSRFTIGVDTKAQYYMRFDKLAYFNEELGFCHNFTTVWIQPNGNPYKRYSSGFPDYKAVNVSWSFWQSKYVSDDYIFINSSTPVGDWKVEVYLDSYFNNTWKSYGPVATTPFVVGNGTVANWTFMVYLDADVNVTGTESAAINVFEKMAAVGSSTQVNIVVQMDRYLGQGGYGNWTDCKRFYVTKGITPTPANAMLNLSEVDMGDPGTLRDFLNWTIGEFPANYYFLVLWDHGTGFVGLCFDSSTPQPIDSLTLPELSQALSELPVRIDVVLTDACAMSMTEVAYNIKDCVNVLIGEEGLGWSPAPYDDYLSKLTSNPSMLPSAFAIEVVRDYINWCSLPQIQNATMAATDLIKISGLVAAVDDFALKLKEKEILFHEQISLARNLTERYPGPYAGQSGYYIDIYDFAQLARQYVTDAELQNTAYQVMTMLESTIILEENKACPNSHGLSIFFPNEKAKYDSVRNAYEEIDFAKDTPWDEFLKYHLSGFFLTTIQMPYSSVTIEFDKEPYKTDTQGKLLLFVPSGSYNLTAPTLVYNATGPGSRGNFIRWNDSTNPSKIITVTGPATYTAYYKTQYQVTFDQTGIETDFTKTVLTINGVGYNVTALPSSSWWDNGTTISFAFQSLLLVTPKRYVWNSTSGLSSLEIASLKISSSGNITANYSTQYRIAFGQSGVGSDFTAIFLTVDKIGYSVGNLSSYFWWDISSIHNFTFLSPLVVAKNVKQYVWNSTSGLSSQRIGSIKVSTSDNVTGNYRTQHYLNITSAYGSPTPVRKWFETGESINVSVTSPVAGPLGTRYVCTGWNGSGGISSSGINTYVVFTIENYSSITWDWKTQYLLTISLNPSGLSPQPDFSPSGPWYDNGTTVNCRAQTISGYTFDRWTVDGANRDPGVNSILITMDRPHQLTTHYLAAPAWWDTLLGSEIQRLILGLVGISITVTLVSTVWIRTKRKGIVKAQIPVATTVSEVLPDRVNTGYADLDNLLLGGIPENYAVILTSPSCDERNLLIKKFLETGARKGEVTFYVTIDPAEVKSLAEQFPSNFCLFICNPQADAIIKESLPNLFKLKGVENLTDISIALTSAFRRLDQTPSVPRRACIEIISDVLLQHQAVQTRRWLTDLITELRSRGFTTLAVMTPQMHHPEEVHAILDLFEGEINISEKEAVGLEKFLTIRKMYNQKYVEAELPLRKDKLES